MDSIKVAFLFRMNLGAVEPFLNISCPFLSSLLGGCNSKATVNPPESDDKNGQEMFNGSEILLIESIL